MSDKITQFRICFTQPTPTGKVDCSTKWFDSIKEAQASRWINEDNAKIVTR